MSLLRKILAAKPVKTPLEFGINKNVRLVKIDNEERKRDGEPVPVHCFLTFAQFNSKGEVIAQSEFNYFNLNHEYDNTLGNLGTEVSQLQSIADVLNPGTVIDPTEDYEDEDELMADLKSKKGCKKLQTAVWKAFNKAVGKKVGMESPMLSLKVVTDYKTGKYLNLPGDATIVELADTEASESVLRITPNEIKNRDKALVATTSATPDEAGDRPTKASAVIDI